MTNEEALKIITEFDILLSRGTGKTKLPEAILNCQSALLKQIPKKPRKYKASRDLIYFECSRCDNKIQADVKYCRYCGQALDWGGNR